MLLLGAGFSRDSLGAALSGGDDNAVDALQTARERGERAAIDLQLPDGLTAQVTDVSGHRLFARSLLAPRMDRGAVHTVADAVLVAPAGVPEAELRGQARLAVAGGAAVALVVGPGDHTPLEDAGLRLVHVRDAAGAAQCLYMLPLPESARDRPVRVPVDGVYKVGGIGTVLAGKVAAGSLGPGTPVFIAPRGISTACKSAEMMHSEVTARAGDTCGFSLVDASIKHRDVARGDVLCDAPVPPVWQVQALVRLSMEIREPVSFRAHTVEAPCRGVRVAERVHPRTGVFSPFQEGDRLRRGDVLVVVVDLDSAVHVDVFREFPGTGVCWLECDGMEVARGIVEAVGAEVSGTLVKSARFRPARARLDQ